MPYNNTTTTPPTLLTLTSLIVSRTHSFESIETRYKNIIPEPVQKSIIYHSFPKQDSQVLVYASADFNPDRYSVEQVVQIGFHVSGVVYEVAPHQHHHHGSKKKVSTRRASSLEVSNNEEESEGTSALPTPCSYSVVHPSSSQQPHNNGFKVSATFDRGKITSVTCNCSDTESNSLIFWCDHVVALALYRIRKCTVGVDFVLRVPISETLLQLNRSQLQKLVQYLISDHTEVLPTAQRLADEILFMKTDDNFINRIHGAPDPTAGPSPQDPHSWALNESQIQAQVRQFILSSNNNTSNNSTTPTPTQTTTSTTSGPLLLPPTTSPPTNVIQTLIEKIYKMISSKDSNAERILQIITNELVRASSTSTIKQHNSSRTPPPPPALTISNSTWDQIIRIWNVIVLKPNKTETEAKTLETVLLGLSRNENLPECEDYLISPDDDVEELAASDQESDSEDESNSLTKRPRIAQTRSYSIFITPLNLLRKKPPYPCDYQIQALNSQVCHGNHDVAFALQILAQLRKTRVVKLENCHLLFNVLKHTNVKEAYEVGLIGLTTPVVLKPTHYSYEKHLKLVEKLISKLVGLPSSYPELLSNYVVELLGTKRLYYSGSFPLLSFASYVFSALGGNELAYKFALKNLHVISGEQAPGGSSTTTHQNFVNSHLEAQQIGLATSLLTSAKDNEARLEEISNTLMRVVKSNTNLFRLAQEVFKHSVGGSNSSERNTTGLVNVAFNIALHVVKNTKYTVHRRRWDMVRWVVSCGVEIGVVKLFYLVRNWGEYFTPVEAVGTVASNILAWVGGSSSSSSSNKCVGSSSSAASERGSSSVVCSERGCNTSNKLGVVDKRVLEELAGASRNLALQCAKNDPQGCALNTLTLCETDPISFETSYQIVLESASKEFLTPQQIFTIARYMEHRGYTQRAYRLAVIALQYVHIGYNQDTHSLISEIHWTCNLSHQLSTPPTHHVHHHHTNNSHHHHHHNHHNAASSSNSTTSSSSSNRYNTPYNYKQLPNNNNTGCYETTTNQPTTELENLIPLLIRNIKCATVLTEILRRSITIMTSYENAYQKGGGNSSSTKKLKTRVYEKLSLLIEGTIDSYITTTHSRLVHISPRHYSDFIEFLGKAKENFLLAPGGSERFKVLVESMKVSYKGKKKLLLLLGERFG